MWLAFSGLKLSFDFLKIYLETQSGLGFVLCMETISQYLGNEKARSEFYLVNAIRETAKAIGVAVEDSKRIAWFPKSKSFFLVDDFYNQPKNKWAVPMWAVNRAAAEIGTHAHRIG